MHRHPVVTKAFDRGSILLVVYTAFSMSGSKKSLASGLPMALVFFGTGAVGLIMLPLNLFHQIQLFVCAVIASRMSRTVPVG